MSSSEGEEPRIIEDTESEFSGFDKNDLVLGANEIVENTAVEQPRDSEPETDSSGDVPQARGKNTCRNSKTQKMTKSKSKTTKSKPAKKTPVAKNKKPKKPKNILEKLSSQDIELLKKKLGVANPTPPSQPSAARPKPPSVTKTRPVIINDYEEEADFVPDYFDDEHDENFDPKNVSRLRVEIDRDDISDSEFNYSGNNFVPRGGNKDMSSKLLQAMFGKEAENTEGTEWAPPKLKSVVRGEAISPSLAKLINTTCTSACCTEDIVQKYQIPENCSNLSPPTVNQEVWKILEKKGRSYDRMLVDIQTLVASGMVPIIKLAETMGENINQSAKQCISDALTLFGQVQYHLSLRRRYIIRPNLKKKYKNICNQSTPITNQLFGDDIAKEIKNCDTGISLAFQRYESRHFRGRQSVGSYRNAYRRGRMHPYGQQQYGQYSQYGNGRGSTYSYRARRRPVATAAAPAPNE